MNSAYTRRCRPQTVHHPFCLKTLEAKKPQKINKMPEFFKWDRNSLFSWLMHVLDRTESARGVSRGTLFLPDGHGVLPKAGRGRQKYECIFPRWGKMHVPPRNSPGTLCPRYTPSRTSTENLCEGGI